MVFLNLAIEELMATPGWPGANFPDLLNKGWFGGVGICVYNKPEKRKTAEPARELGVKDKHIKGVKTDFIP